MKKLLFFIFGVILSHAFCKAQTQIWKMQDYSVGQTLNSFPAGFTNSSPTMAEVIQLSANSYRMYVNVQLFGGQKHCIGYASSSDAITWNYEDTCFCGSSDTTARNYVVGGPSIIKLPNGDYRMYYRATQKFTISPSYHVRSATSTDGINFSQNGICIDIQPYNSSSDFLIVGHGTYWQYPNGTFGGIFSGNPDTSSVLKPSSLFYTSSADGLTWSNFDFLYQNHHDPIVVKKNNQYILYSMNLTTYMATAVSNDGSNWPSATDSVSFLDTVNAPMLIGGTKRIGDVGGIVMPNNEIYLYTNFGTTTGPSVDIIRYELQNPAQISEMGVADNKLTVFPNPNDGRFRLTVNSDRLQRGEIEIFNLLGESVFYSKEIYFNDNVFDLSFLEKGVYLIQLNTPQKSYISKMVIQNNN